MSTNNTDTDFTPWLRWIDAQYEQMLSRTIELSHINSGSFNPQGVNDVGSKLLEYAHVLEAQVEVLSVAPFKHIFEGVNG